MADTVVDINPKQLGIKHWKLVECGSALDFCDEDMVPAGPINQLCKAIDNDPERTCEFASFPDISHKKCGSEVETMDSCRVWFDGLQ